MPVPSERRPLVAALASPIHRDQSSELRRRCALLDGNAVQALYRDQLALLDQLSQS